MINSTYAASSSVTTTADEPHGNTSTVAATEFAQNGGAKVGKTRIAYQGGFNGRGRRIRQRQLQRHHQGSPRRHHQRLLPHRLIDWVEGPTPVCPNTEPSLADGRRLHLLQLAEAFHHRPEAARQLLGGLDGGSEFFQIQRGQGAVLEGQATGIALLRTGKRLF